MTDSDNLNDVKTLRDKIELWTRRSEMAFQQGNSELVVKALYLKWQLQCSLAAAEGTEPPDAPENADSVFGDRSATKKQIDQMSLQSRPDEPDQSSPVRR